MKATKPKPTNGRKIRKLAIEEGYRWRDGTLDYSHGQWLLRVYFTRGRQVVHGPFPTPIQAALYILEKNLSLDRKVSG